MGFRPFAAARATAAAHREARRFAQSVKPGTTYYSVSEVAQPWGDEDMVREWTFRWSSSRQAWVCGSVTAAGAWLGWGPLTTRRPAGLKSIHGDSGRLHDPLAALTEAERRELDAVR